jgi:hypothetical protein
MADSSIGRPGARQAIVPSKKPSKTRAMIRKEEGKDLREPPQPHPKPQFERRSHTAPESAMLEAGPSPPERASLDAMGAAGKRSDIESGIHDEGERARRATAGREEEAPLGETEPVPARQAPADRVDAEEAFRADKLALPVTAMLDEAEKMLQAENYAGADQAFSEVLRRLGREHPERHRALLGRARANEGLGNLAEAQRAYRALAGESSVHQDLAQRKLRELAEQSAK